MLTTTATKTTRKAATPVAEETAKPKPEKKVYTATGRSGQETTRSSATAVTHSVFSGPASLPTWQAS